MRHQPASYLVVPLDDLVQALKAVLLLQVNQMKQQTLKVDHSVTLHICMNIFQRCHNI